MAQNLVMRQLDERQTEHEIRLPASPFRPKRPHHHHHHRHHRHHRHHHHHHHHRHHHHLKISNPWQWIHHLKPFVNDYIRLLVFCKQDQVTGLQIIISGCWYSLPRWTSWLWVSPQGLCHFIGGDKDTFSILVLKATESWELYLTK